MRDPGDLVAIGVDERHTFIGRLNRKSAHGRYSLKTQALGGGEHQLAKGSEFQAKSVSRCGCSRVCHKCGVRHSLPSEAKTVSALRAYKQLYHEAIVPRRVAELLILREDMPRSLRASYREIDALFVELGQRYHREYECFRIAGDMYRRLRYGRMEDIFAVGLHPFLTEFISRTSRLGEQIVDDFQLAA